MNAPALSQTASPETELEQARDRARLAEQSLLHLERLSALTHDLSRSLTRDEVAAVLLDRSRELLGCANSSLVLKTGDGGKLRLLTSSSTSHELAERWAPVIDSEENPLLATWHTGKPLFLGTREAINREWPKLALSDEAKDKLSGLAVYALEGAAGRLGVIGFSFYEATIFDEPFRRFMSALAHQGAMALDRAALHEAQQAAVRARDEFLSIASHELKTPLTPLILKLETMSRALEEGKTDRLHVHVESMRRQMKKMSHLVNGLLDVSRISAGKFQLEKQQVDLAEVVREVVNRVEPEAAAAGCTLYVDLAEKVRGEWDPMRVEQVVTNLLSNALKYGAGHPIRVALNESARSVQLVVDDEGIGIEPKELPRLFGRFERGAAAQNFSGLGLGLYITRQIVEAHGGVIRVESAPGKGSRFEVELPRA